jgi:TolB-like protein
VNVENGSSGYELELRLVGPVRLLRRDGTDVTPKGRKAQGLLALLGVSPKFRRKRAWLQDKLWSDRGPEQGGASLRQELAGLRRALGEESRCLVSEAGWIELDPARVRVTLDPEPGDWDLTGTPPEFAAGLDIADPEFEDWIRDQRAAIEKQLLARPAPVPLIAAGASFGAVPLASHFASPAVSKLAVVDGAFDPDQWSPSIAVMPLTVVSEQPELSILGDGLVKDVIGRLACFRRLDVIAFASTAATHALGLAPREVGRRLDVRYVTQGVLWLNRTRLRLSFDLVDAATERVAWGRTFNSAYDAFFDMEDEIAMELASGVMTEIEQLERARVRARDPSSLDAYGLCLRGIDELLRYEPSACDLALDLFGRAADREHDYARALAGISRAHGLKYRWTEERVAALAEAENYAVRAVHADANDPGAHAALGWVALYSRSHERSLAAYSRAMELNPSDADVIAEYADSLRHAGSADEAIPLFDRAIRLNPQMSDSYRRDLAAAHFVRRDFESAIRTVRRMRNPQISYLILTASYALAGQMEEAKATADAVRRERPGFSSDAWMPNVPDRNAEDTALYLEGLKRAGL